MEKLNVGYQTGNFTAILVLRNVDSIAVMVNSVIVVLFVNVVFVVLKSILLNGMLTKVTCVLMLKMALRTKMVINNSTLEQMSCFKYLGCAVSYESEYVIKIKINKFRNICDTIYRNIRNKTRDVYKRQLLINVRFL